MNDVTNIWFFIIPFTLAAALPGPAQGALVAQVLSRGGTSTVPFAVGMVLGNALWLCAAIFGLAALALRFEWVFLAIKWLGVGYLLFVAWKLWNAETTLESGDTPMRGGGVLAGSALTLGNPKAVVFFGAALPHAFDMGSLTAPQIVGILALGLMIDTLVQAAYLVAASRGRALIRSPRQMRTVNRAAAGTIAGSAALIASRG